MTATESRSADRTSPSFEDTVDFANAERGFIGCLEPCVVKNAQGQIVWNNDEYNFVHEEPCPTTVEAKLWRQARLLSKQGLYCISPSIYQVRGFDISHITFVEGQSGLVVIDPLISCECAAAAMDLYKRYRGSRPVKAVIYTHSHIDHFGGAAGILPPPRGKEGLDDVKIIAPEHFMEEATSENVFAGPIMRKRSAHMYGSQLPRSSIGQVGVGLGMGTSRGTTSLVPPTVDITYTGQSLTIDGIHMVFQMVPNTEAPAELNIYFPNEHALLVAECATHALHNIVTLRGALVRDAKAWSRYLDETLVLYCEEAGAEVQFGSHGWPTWGNDNITSFLEQQRDLYAYIHDQTVRQMNRGWNGTEIAERMVLPPALRRAWHTQGFYGSVNHNVKGIYQRYMTWFDGAAENLWKWPPKEEGIKYVACIGGPEELLKKADGFINEGDLRFAATLLGHVVAAEDGAGGPASARLQCRDRLAYVFESLGFGAENATWRNFYLSQAMDLRNGKRSRGQDTASLASFAPRLAVEQWLGGLSIIVDGQAAGREHQPINIDIHIKDIDERWRLILSNGALTYRRLVGDRVTTSPQGSVRLTLEKAELCEVLNGKRNLTGIADVEGDVQLLGKLLSFASIDAGMPHGASSHL
ncbi:uncharacterized protein A1O9_05496 [Exophiala aquamarina CBS 119918]|uniref:Metallo-beta-lactamase domain-containing protein n=1 Tax=Exophiala aquamarina CBS 119918 TaxID=1182545 RepID=A0A072PE51_9EURO|nr:uncharacterized protein A1O9_05496 [Exophiala aquamarina CBS 119918]KEF57578.1 hypothetical protein A1O9_05496 [Exophiala aquamarina CBS 119918]